MSDISQELSDLKSVRAYLDQLMLLPDSRCKQAVMQNKLGEDVYLDAMSIYLDRAISSVATLRTQLADATRKLEEARKNERRYIWLRDIGDDTWVPLAKRPQVLFTHQIDDAIDQAIEQGKGGDDASPTDAMELPIPERREHVFKEDKQGIRCSRCGQHAWRADSNCNPNLLD